MGLILDSHPQIKNIDEAYYDYSVNAKTNVKRQIKNLKKTNKASTKSVKTASKNRSHSANLPNILSFKLPTKSADLSFIKTELQPDKIIWMIRNPMDVIASMVKLHIKINHFVSVSWAARFADVEIIGMLKKYPPAILEKHANDISFFQMISSVPSVMRTESQIIRTAAICWNLKQESVKMMKKQKLPIMVLRYEDLVGQPKKTLKKTVDFLNIDWSDKLLKHHKLHKGISIGNTQNNQKISNRNVGSGKRMFGKDSQKIIKNICKKTAKKFGYRL